MRKLSSKLVLTVGALLAALAVAGWSFSRGGGSSIEEDEARRLQANAGARAAFAQGEAAAGRGSFAEARTGFETAVRLDPQSAIAFLNLGLMEARLGHRRPAIEALRRATALRPHWAFAWQQLANVLADDRQLEPAADAAARAAELAPRAAGAWIIRGHVALLQGNAADAQKWSLKAAELEPGNATAWLAAGDALMLTPTGATLEEAAKAFRRAAELEPGVYAFRRLGEAYRQSGKLPEAVEALRTAVRLAPRDTASASQLAQVLQAAGDTAESKRWAARAQALQDARYRRVRLEREAAEQPGDPSRQHRLAAELVRQGDGEEAAQIYRRLLRADPLDEEARRALARLEAAAADTPAEGGAGTPAGLSGGTRR